MCSASSLVVAALAVLPAVAACERAESAPAPVLRVCADPNNLPFSNAKGEGFENELARLIARDLGRTVEYTWFPQRRGFVRNTLKAERCDLVMGVPAGYELVATTPPYYRSSYVFVTRADRDLALTSLDDPRLKTLKIGLHAIGDDYSNVPAAEGLAARGLADHIVGYSIYGDYSQPDPPRRLIDAVARGDVDVAIAWGPLAGYFAARAHPALRVTPLVSDDPGTSFSIAMGVRKGDTAMKTTIERELVRRRTEIARVLARYHIPTLPAAKPPVKPPVKEVAR